MQINESIVNLSRLNKTQIWGGNMKKVAVFVAGLMTSVASFAGGYGVVDYPKVIESSTYVKQQEVNLQNSVKADNTKLEQLRKELIALQQKTQTEAKNLKEADLKKLAQQYAAKAEEYAKTQHSIATKVQQGMRQIETTLNVRVLQVTDQLRSENKLDLILERGSVISYDKSSDLTDKVIQRLNAIK